MPVSRILALSSSRVGTSGYLKNAAPIISKFLGNEPLKIAFVPFASVDNDYLPYLSLVQKALQDLPCSINVVTPENAKELIRKGDGIMVGGGNTFKLLHDIYHLQLLDVIRDKVSAGAPYIGWSAGANITGPTIGTTNDMPIIEPKSFDALGLLPFQINPHYINAPINGHNGETRDQRLIEFMKLNPGIPVVCLPEGTALLRDGNQLTFSGDRNGILFTNSGSSEEPVRKELAPGEDMSWLL